MTRTTWFAIAAVAVLYTAPLTYAAQRADEGHSTTVSLVDGTVEMDSGGGQSDDHLFDGVSRLAAKAKDASEINLDKSMLSLAAQKGGQKAEIARKLDAVTIRSYEFAKEGEYNMADVEAILKRLDGDNWKHMVRTRDGKDLTDICVKQDGDGTAREIVIVTADPKDVSLIHLRGSNLSLSDMNNLGGMAGEAMRGSASKGTTTTTTSSTSTTTLHRR